MNRAGVAIALSAGAVVLVLAVVGAVQRASETDPPHVAAIPRSAGGPTSASTRAPASAAVPAAPLPGQPTGLSVPSVGLSTAVRSMPRPGSGTIDPPTSNVAYWISSYGQAGPITDNTVYIAGHTCHGRCSAVFGPFLDIPDSATTVHPGDPVDVETPSGTWRYTVTSTELWDKGDLADDTELWKKIPGRLVLITCFQYAGGTSSQQNFVIYAELDPDRP